MWRAKNHCVEGKEPMFRGEKKRGGKQAKTGFDIAQWPPQICDMIHGVDLNLNVDGCPHMYPILTHLLCRVMRFGAALGVVIL